MRRHGAHQRSAQHDEDSLLRPGTLRDVTERRGVLRVTERGLRQSLQAVIVVRYFLVFPIIKLDFSSRPELGNRNTNPCVFALLMKYINQVDGLFPSL